MPLDHFVSQVHLKQFLSPSLDELMYVVPKIRFEEISGEDKKCLSDYRP
jgi:hypothetical protein